MRTSLLVVILLAACGPSAPRTDAGTDAGPPPLDCLGLIECLTACGADDTPCDDACVARATPEGIREATELAVCLDGSGCADDACFAETCAAELLACDPEPMIHEDAGVPEDAPRADAPSDVLPVRIEGTTRDRNDAVGIVTESVGEVVFVRDDAAGEANGYPIDIVAFYRLESLSYTVTVSGEQAGCTTTANESYAPPYNDPFENFILIERAPAGDGLHPYGLATAAHVERPDAIATVCPGLPTGYSDLSVDHYVSHGIDQPHSDLRTFVGSYPRGPRVSSWDLHAVP